MMNDLLSLFAPYDGLRYCVVSCMVLCSQETIFWGEASPRHQSVVHYFFVCYKYIWMFSFFPFSFPSPLFHCRHIFPREFVFKLFKRVVILFGACLTLSLMWPNCTTLGTAFENWNPARNANRSLTALDVGRNFLRDEGLAKLLEGLNNHPALTALGAAANNVTSIGATDLARWLQRSPQVQAVLHMIAGILFCIGGQTIV